MASKMVTDRQALARRVSAAIGVHAGEVSTSLDRQVRIILGEGIAAVEDMQLTLRRMFDAQLAALVTADEAHLDSLAVLEAPRLARDAARDALFTTLTEVRRLADALYGAGGTVLLGLQGPLSRNPEVLLRQAQRALARVSDPDTPRPDTIFSTTTVGEEEWMARLEPPIAALAQAVDEVASARRQTESTLKVKNEALAAFDLTFGRTSRFMEALFDLSGLPSFAARLRSPITRRGSSGGGVVIDLPLPPPPVEPEEPDVPSEEEPPLAGVG